MNHRLRGHVLQALRGEVAGNPITDPFQLIEFANQEGADDFSIEGNYLILRRKDAFGNYNEFKRYELTEIHG